jgi:uncharacterized protein (TIGR00251 family)
MTEGRRRQRTATSLMEGFQIEKDTVRFWLKVKPRSNRERLTMEANGEMKLELHAPPAEGQANEACVGFFAQALRIPKTGVTILAGHKSRRKLIGISAPGGQEIAGRLRALARQGTDGRRR